MRVLVAYASRHGATAGIAERVAAGLREAGLSTEARPVAQVRDVEAYDAFVIGAAAYRFRPLGTEVADEQGRDVFEATRPRQRVISGIGTRSTRGCGHRP